MADGRGTPRACVVPSCLTSGMTKMQRSTLKRRRVCLLAKRAVWWWCCSVGVVCFCHLLLLVLSSASCCLVYAALARAAFPLRLECAGYLRALIGACNACSSGFGRWPPSGRDLWLGRISVFLVSVFVFRPRAFFGPTFLYLFLFIRGAAE